MLLLSLLLACAAGDDDTSAAGPGDAGAADGGGDDGGADGGGAGDGGATAPLVPDLPVSGCGLSPYAWRPLDPMGSLVAVEEATDLSYDVDTVNQILDLVGLEALTPVPYGVRAWRVRYGSQDKGQDVEVSGYIALPDTDPGAPLPVMLWNHPTTGFHDACAPTALGITGGAYALLLAAHGFAVAAPDHLGLVGVGEPSGELHPWIVAEPGAVVGLDAVRALLRFLDDGATYGVTVTADPSRTVIFGASEGGFTSLWADRYQAEYLPEVQIAGVVAAIPATDPLALATLGATTTSDTTRAITAALVTGAAWHEGVAPVSEVILAPFDATVPEALASECEGWDDAFQAAEAPEQIFTPAFLSAAAAGGDWSEALLPWSCYLGEGVLRDSAIPRGSTAPVLVVTGERDELAWPQPTHDDVLALCAQGYRIEHVQCAGADHTGAAVAALPKMIAWALAAGRGEDPSEGATTCAIGAPVACEALR